MINNKYWNYFKYVMEHKKNVFIECWKEGLYLHAFTHDLSKFLPSEFIPYANWFYDDLGVKHKEFTGDYDQVQHDYFKEEFNKAWEHHYTHNKHHWNYWIGKNMPVKYIDQMICDWKAMSVKFGDTEQEFYLKNYKNINMDRESRHALEIRLGVAYSGLDDFASWSTIEEIIDNCLKYEKNNPKSFSKDWFYGEYLKEFKDKYNVDMLKILGYK